MVRDAGVGGQPLRSMQTYANALLIAIPLFSVLVLVETLYAVYRLSLIHI